MDRRIVLLFLPLIGPAMLAGVFGVLKIAHVIAWPWVWCLAPLWLWLAGVLAAVAIGGSVILICLQLEAELQ